MYGNVGLDSPGKEQLDGVATQNAEVFGEHDMLVLDFQTFFPQRGGNRIFGDASEEVSLFVGVSGNGDFGAVGPGGGFHELLLGESAFFGASGAFGFDGLDVGFGGFDGQTLGKEIISGVSRFDLHNIPIISKLGNIR